MLQSFHFYFPSVTYFLCCIQVDDTPPLGSRSGRPIELLPSGPISLIGNNAPTLAAIMHRGVRLKKITTKRTKTSPSVAATALAQAFKVNFRILLFIPISSLCLSHLYSQTSYCHTSIPVHRQRPEVRLPMPPSPVNRREKVPRVLDQERSAREQQRLLLLQDLRS